MSRLAQKLTQLRAQPKTSVLPSAIFGSAAAGLAVEGDRGIRYRIGMWPLICPSDPELAMGIWSALSYLLEDDTSVEIYRIFARLDGDPESFEADISRLQFSPDDWLIEGLNENIVMWGNLIQEQDQYRLEVMMENDLIDDEEEDNAGARLEFVFQDLSDLANRLPQVAGEMNAWLGSSPRAQSEQTYAPAEYNEEQLTSLLKTVFYWELRLLTFLWGTEWSDEEIALAHAELREIGAATQGEFVSWLVAKATARGLLPGYSLIGELLMPALPQTLADFSASVWPAIILGRALHSFGYPTEAYTMLESAVERFPDSTLCWLALGRLYLIGNRVLDAIDAFQRAIEQDATNTDLFREYGNALLVADYSNLETHEFLLIDLEEFPENPVLWEAIEAYEEVLAINPEDLSALYSQAYQLLQLDIDRFWDDFEALVELDRSGEMIRTLIDELHDVPDLEPGVDILHHAILENEERPDLRIHLALLYARSDLPEEASAELEVAAGLTEDADMLAEIERIKLLVDDPAFEQRFGEISDIVEAGNRISAGDIEYIEDALEKAPSFLEGYLTLAQAYMQQDDIEAASEVLLEARDSIPDSPDVLELLSRVYREAGEMERAFEVLNQGLAINPYYAPLLATAALYLFEDGQLDGARELLARAESVSPRHPRLTRVKRHIANQIGGF